MKVEWSENDDLVCCEEYVKKYLVYKDYNDVQTLVYNLNLKLKRKIEEISIYKKLRNIKRLLLQLKIIDHSDLRPLNHFSEQNLIALCKVLQKYEIPFNIDLEKVKGLLDSRK